jgi:hypothetical protein
MTMRSLAMSSLRKVLRGLFGPLTARGWSLLAAGGAAVLGGLAIPEPDLVRVGALLVVLPVVSALIAGRPRYRLRRLARAEECASYAARPPASLDLRRDGTTARRGLAASASPVFRRCVYVTFL